MLRTGNENLFKPQLNDPIIDVLGNVYEDFKRIRKAYLKGDLDKTEYNTEYRKVRDYFEKEAVERFGIKIRFKDSSVWAVMPIINDNILKNKVTTLEKESKRSLKQIHKFKDWIEDNMLLINYKKVMVINLPKEFYITLLSDLSTINELSKEEFIAIILHEIGHIFTFLETYTNTTKYTIRLMDAFLEDKSINEVADEIGITYNKDDTDKDIMIKIGDKVSKDIERLGTISTGDVDMEYEADDFVVKFGYGSYLARALTKLTGAEQLKPKYIPVMIMGAAISRIIYLFLDLLFLVLFTSINIVLVTTVILFFIEVVLRTFIMVLLQTHSRNPNIDEHGNMYSRIKNIERDIIKILRLYDLDKDEKKLLIKQIEDTIKDLAIIDNSVFNKILVGTLVRWNYLPNLNTTEQLSEVIDDLINNPLYVHKVKLELMQLGTEKKDDNYKPKGGGIFFREIYLGSTETSSNRYLGFALEDRKDDKVIDELIKALFKYGYTLDINYKTLEGFIKANEVFSIKTGITSTALVPNIHREIKPDDRVVNITVDADKVRWMLDNPYLKVYNIDVIKANDIKYIYVLEMNRVKPAHEATNKKLNKLLDKISKINRDVYMDYGNRDLDFLIKEILKRLGNDTPKDIKEQLKVMSKTFKDVKADAPELDMHGANIAYDYDKHLIILDPFYIPNRLGRKVPNKVKIDPKKVLGDISIANENIKYQKDDPIIKELVSYYEELTDRTMVSNLANFKKILGKMNDIIYDRFGIPIFTIPANPLISGFACIPMTTVDHSGLSKFNDKLLRGYGSLIQILTRKKDQKIIDLIKNGKLIIDLENAKIEGLGKELKSVLIIESGRNDLFLTHKHSNLALTPRELTAVTLHEIGHLFTYIEAFAKFTRTNIVLEEYFNSDKLTKLKPEYNEDREKDHKRLHTISGGIYDTIRSMLASFISAINFVGGADGNVLLKVLDDTNNKGYSLGTVSTYSTDSETVADQFATRFGLGPELASGLRKMMTYNAESKLGFMIKMIIFIYRQFLTKVILSGGMLLKYIHIFIQYTMFKLTMFAIIRLLLGPYKTYESLPERIDAIKRDLISQLRNKKIDKETKNEILDMIDEIEEQYNKVSATGMGSLIFSVFIPMKDNVVFDANTRKRFIDMFDKLINNDLHIYEHKLKNI